MAEIKIGTPTPELSLDVLLSKAEVKDKFHNYSSEVLLPAMNAPNTESNVGCFAKSWPYSTSGERDELVTELKPVKEILEQDPLEIMLEKSNLLLLANKAGRQVKAGEGQASYEYNPETKKFDFKYVDVDGAVQKNSVDYGDFLLGYQLIAEQAPDGSSLKKQAKDAVIFLGRQLEISVGGQSKITNADCDKQMLSAAIGLGAVKTEEAFGSLSRVAQLAVLSTAKKDYDIEYFLVGNINSEKTDSLSSESLQENLEALNTTAGAIDGELRKVYEPIFSRLSREKTTDPSDVSDAISALSAEMILAPSPEEGQTPEEILPDIVYQQRLISKIAALEALSGDDENVSALIEEAKTALGEEKATPTEEVVAKFSGKFLAYACKKSGIEVSGEEIASLTEMGINISKLAEMSEADRETYISDLFEEAKSTVSQETADDFRVLISKIFPEGIFKENLAKTMKVFLFGSDDTYEANRRKKLTELEPGTLEKIGSFALNNSPPGMLVRLGKSLGRKETYSKQNLIMAGMIFGTLFPQLISSLLSEE